MHDFFRLYIWVHPERWSEGSNPLWEAWWTGNQVGIFLLFLSSLFLLIYWTASALLFFFFIKSSVNMLFLLHWHDLMFKQNEPYVEHLLFCRMPDPDFSVNYVKTLVGKTSDLNSVIRCYCKHLCGQKHHNYRYELTYRAQTPPLRQQAHDRCDGRKHSEGNRDVHGSVDTLLWDPSSSKREALQCHQPGVQPH